MDAAAGGAAGAGPPGAGAPGAGAPGAGAAGARGRGPGGGRRRAAELRAGLRPVVQAEHGDHDAGQFGGDLQRAFTVAVLDRVLPDAGVRRAYQAQRGPERRGQGRDRAPHHDPARARVGAGDLKAVPGQRGRDELQVGRVGAVLLGELLRGQGGRAFDQVPGHRRPVPGHQRHLDLPGFIHRAQLLRLRQRTALAAGQRHEGLSGHHRSLGGRRRSSSQYVVPPGSRGAVPAPKRMAGSSGRKCGGRERPQPFPPSAGCLVSHGRPVIRRPVIRQPVLRQPAAPRPGRRSAGCQSPPGGAPHSRC